MQKTFLLGVGSQKGGTTWLHSQLARQDWADFGALKEYHVLDAVSLPDCRQFRVGPALYAAAHLHGILRHRKARALYLRGRFQRDLTAYFAYFAGLLARPGITLTGDITPAYSGLSTQSLQRVRDGFGPRGIRVVPVFLMRDPVERCWSAVRMHQRNRQSTEGVRHDIAEQEALRAYYRSPDAQFRTAYQDTVTRLQAVFPREDIFLGLYERLFTPAEIGRMAELLGHAIHGVDFGHQINVSPKSADIDPGLAREIAAFYRPAYECAAAAFGADTIRALWQHAHLVL